MGLGRIACLSALPALLAAQAIPVLPSAPSLDLPGAGELLPLRPLPWEEGQGRRLPFDWRGEEVEELGEVWTLRHGALQSREVMLLADLIRYDRLKGRLEAEGNIRLEASGLRLRCQRLSMEWEHQTGEAAFLEMELPPSWVLRSDHVAFATLRHWDFRQVEVSPCPQENPGWKARLSELKLNLDGFATLRNARLFLGNVFLPPYFIPWAVYPAKAARSSGLLPPLLGASSRLGTLVGVPYYQTLGDEADATLTPQFMSKDGVLWGAEGRWRPDPTHQGSVSGQVVHSRLAGETRYRYAVRELWQREDGWQLSVDANRASDGLMEADYGRGVGALGTNAFDSSVYVGKSFPWLSVAFRAADQRTFFLPEDPLYQSSFPGSLTRRTLPQAEVRMFPLALGRYYMDADYRASRLGYVIQAGDGLPDQSSVWNRNDLAARIYGRVGQWGPVRVDGEVLGRLTHYSATLGVNAFDPTQGTDGVPLDPSQASALALFNVEGPSALRALGSARLLFSGPQVGRLFERFSLFGYKGQLKHLVEPYVGFTQTSRFGRAGSLARFDEVDIQPGAAGSAHGERSIEVGLKQHFLGREGAGHPYADLVRWRVGTKFHLAPVLLGDGRVKRGWASLDSVIDVEPHEAFRLSFKRSADVVDGGTDDALSAEYKGKDGRRYTLAAFSTSINRFLVRQRGIQIGGLERFWDDRVRLEFQATYDQRLKTFASSQAALAYVTPCVATSLRYSHLALQLPGQTGKEDRLDLVLTLRGLGDLFSFRQ
jgi:hypothetical protein